VVSACLHRCVVGVQHGLQHNNAKRAWPIAARSRDEKVQRNGATLCWKPRTILACFPELDATLPSALFSERPVQLVPGVLPDDLRLPTAIRTEHHLLQWHCNLLPDY
jgi:hypothetical protein